MSTRATYSFKLEDFEGAEVFFFCKHPNYPQGAANFFRNLHNNLPFKQQKYKGGLADIFIKANAGLIQLTDSHERHKDTEYRYYMDKDGFLKAQELKAPFYEEFESFFETFFHGHYTVFISLYHEFKESEYRTWVPEQG